MARDYYDESKKRRKVVKKSQPSSTSINKSIKQAQERGAKRTAQTNVKSQQSFNNKRTTNVSGRSASSSRHVQDQRTPSQSYRDRTNQPTRRASVPASSSANNQRRNTPATASEMRRQNAQNQKMTAGVTREQQEKTRQRFSTAKEMMNQRAEEGQKRKMGSQATAEQKKIANRALKNTPELVKKSVQDTISGHKKTIADITTMTASNKNGTQAKAMKMGLDPNKDKKQMRELERERIKTVEESKRIFEEENEKQEERQAKWDEKTKKAKGLEKAYYGAVESGVGMATDMVIGLGTPGASLAAMGSRTYGSTRGQAQKEGATEKEDRLYSLLQAGKEVGTEMMLPGAGVAKKAYGRVGIPLAEKAANRLLKGLSGRAAEVAHSGLKLALGMGEENFEEAVGWGLDPIIKEYTYGKNVRQRNAEEAREAMNRISDNMRSQIKDENDAASASAYLSSDSFLEDTIKDYMAEGMSEEQAEKAANRMRDFLTASLIGDTDTMAQIEDEMSNEITGHSLRKDYSIKELLETVASTSLLTGVTGLPGTVTTAMKGSTLRDELGDEGVRALAKTAIDFEDETDSYKGQAARDRIDSGKELTSTQVYELAEATQKQIEKDSRRQEASVDNASKQIRSENLVSPYGLNANGEMVLDETTNKNYESSAKSAETTIKTFVNNSEEKESITDTEIRDGSRAIAGFKTGIFTLDDANELNYSNTAIRDAFKEETGIDLNQYVVKDKNGKVDIPKTNAATKDALFAMASDNLVESAREATVNWMDNVKGEVVSQVTARMGAEGSLALQSALDDVDERNRSEYMMVANASDMLYQSALNLGTEWDNVKAEATKMFPNISENKLQAMYEAGLDDRAKATYEYEGKKAKLGEAIASANALEDSDRANVTGKVFVDTETPLKGTVVRAFTEVATNLGVDIHLVDNLPTDSGQQANGMYDKGTIYINANSSFEQNMGYIFMHEVTHHLKEYAPEEYAALERLVREKWFEYDDAQMQSEIAKRIDLYSRATNGKQTLTEAEALEEIIADAAHEFLNDPNFANEVAEDNPSLAKAVLESIRNALRMLRRILSTGSIEDETHMNSLFSQLDIFDEAERLWLTAYRTAVANKAALAIDNWQDDVNAQSGSTERLSLSDISEQEDADYMKAVESGDMETAQRMVDEAAAKAMPNTATPGRWLHGTENDFTVFDFSQGGKNGAAEGFGIYLARDKDVSEHYGKRLIEGYVNIEHPATDTERTLSKADLVKLISATVDQEAERLAEDYDGDVEAAKRDTWISNYTYTYDKSLDASIGEVADSILDMNENDKDIIQEVMAGMAIRDYSEAEKFYDILTDLTGIDGFTTTWENIALEGTRDIALAFRSNQIKDSSPVTYDDDGNVIPLSQRFDMENPDIRYSISEEDRAELNKAGVDITEGGSVVRYSLASWLDTDILGLKTKLLKAGFLEKEIDKWIEDVDSVAATISSDMGRLNYASDRFQDALKPNSEYFYTLDLSTLCQKRRLYQGTYNAIMDRIVVKGLQPNDTIRLRKMMDDMGHEVPCGICYEESRKKNEGKFAETWLYGQTDKEWNQKLKEYDRNVKKYEKKLADYNALKNKGKKKPPKEPQKPERWMGYANMEHRDSYIPTIADVTTTTGRERLRKEGHTEALEAYLEYQKGRGSANPKVSFTHTDYRGDILKLSDSDIDKVKHIGGLRIQSFSDFEIVHVIDMMQAIMDMSAKKLTAQAYTKVPSFADIFGGTGVKINLSLIQKMDENGNPMYDSEGNLVFDSKEGIDPDEAFRIREKYSENVGTILVGVSKQQILDAWADPRVDMVIPFHRSGWSLAEFERLGLKGYEDFQDYQSEKILDPKTGEWISFADAKKKKLTFPDGTLEELYSIDYWDNGKTGKENAEKYLKLCAEQKRRPVFYNFLHDNGDGTWSLPTEEVDGYNADGYWKSLIDFKMYDNEGKAAPQKEVQPNFDMEVAQRVMGEYEGNADTLPIAEDVVEAFVKDYAKKHPDVKFSLSADSEGGSLTVGQSLFFNKSKAMDEAGNLLKLYHGTAFAGFNTFYSDRLIWLTTSRRDADAYGGNWEHKAYDPNETVGTEQIVAGDYNLSGINDMYSYMRFDTEADREQFLSEHPDIENVRSIEELEDLNYEGEINDAEFDRLVKADKDIVKDYAKYEEKHSRIATWGEVLDNAEPFSKRDLARAMYAYDSNAAIDEGQEDTKETLLEAMQYIADEYEAESGESIDGLRNLQFKSRVPVGEQSEYIRTVNNRTYEVYANVVNPLIVDMGGKAMEEGGYAYVDAMRENDAYDGIIIKNTSVGRYHDPQTIVIAKASNQVKLTSNESPTENADIRYSLNSDGEELSEGQANYFANSQARDEEGRLVPVFHTTNKGGFTVFDPSRSDDRRSLFFASNFAVSQTYGRHANRSILGATKYQSFEDIEEDFVKNNWRLMPDYLDSGFDKNNIVKHYKIKVKRKGSILKGSELGANDTARFREWLRLSETNDEKASQYQVEFKPIGESQTLTVDSLSEMIDYFNKNAPLPSRGYYECYLNLENPLIVDAKGHLWRDIPYGPEGNSLREHLEELEQSSDLLIESIKVITDEYDDEGIPQTIHIEIDYMRKKPDGRWYLPNTYEKDVFISGEDFDDPGAASMALWTRAEEDLMNWGLPKDYINDLEINHVDYDGDIVWTMAERGDEVLHDFINTKTGDYEIVDAYDYDIDSTYNTRELAELAEDQGYDGVIIKNCYDIGGSSGLKGDNALSDIYIAFSSNQIKDVNNLNPTDNPDIRYSIAPEDEVVSRMAYEAAEDDSNEILEYYEQRLANLTDEEAENIAIRDYDEEDAAMFYSALRSEEPVPYEDYVLEEDRIRMAKSKNDFFSNVNAKWNDRWTTEPGGVLDVKSVKTDVRNLIMGVMQNSDTDSKYKRTLVNKTLMDIRYAYEFFKKDRPELASALLYHSAQRMIDNVQFYVDGTFDQYKDLKHYLRNTRISIGEEYWSDVDYDSFRKRNYNRINLVKGNTNVDQVYQELEEMFPEFFNGEETMSVPDQLLQMEEVLDTVQPYKEAYSSEEAAELVFDIADDLYEIMVNGDEVRSLADTYKARYDAKTKAMKQRHAEAMLRVRKARDEGIQAERQKFREYKERQKATRDHRKHYQRIQKNYDWLVQRILDPTKDKNVPEEFRQSLAEMLQTLDMQTENSKKLEAKTGHVAYKTFKMRELKDRLNEMAIKKGDNGVTIFELDANVGYLMDSLVIKLDGQSVDALDATTISEIDTVLAAIRGAMVRHNKIRIENKSQEISEIAGEITEGFLKQVEKRGKAKKYEGIRGGINAINTSELTPVYFFERLGKFNVMYNEVRYGGFDTYVRNEKHIIERMEEITKPYFNKGKIRKRRPKPGSELDKWRDSRSAQTFTLTNGPITLTTAQMMSLYCLSKREQATKHMYSDNGGIVATPIEAGTKQQKIKERLKGKEETNEKLIVNEADIQTIIAALTPEQINVADQLQQLMANDMADLGNEAHREMYGYNVFEEQDYFPIKVHGNEIATDINDIGDVIQKIKSFGPAKPLDPHADNLIEIDDIFSVTVEHCNGMNLYNAFLVPISDFMRVYNYKQRFDDGKEAITVKDALEAAHGKKALDYIVNFMKDINGIKPDNRGGLEGVLNKALGTAKKTAVFGNIRVALQQPTAIVRAAAEIKGKHLIPFIKLRPEKGVMKEMWKYCPIAYWKSLGYYDAYMGRDLEDTVMNNWSTADAALSDIYGSLDNWTWSLIWRAVKSEQAEAHPEMDTKSEEFLQMCGRRASEVFDKTQVVDSTFHRSDAMRSNQIAIKSLTAFMSEPTLTLNVFRAGWQKAIDQWQDGDKIKAAGTFRKTMSVIILQAALVSLAQALADAWRGKDPGDLWDGGDDDDDEPDEDFMKRFIHNLTYNFFDNLHLENNIYIVKDAMPLFNFMMSKAGDYYGWNDTFRAIMGWDQKMLYSNGNLIYAGGENIVQGVAQIYKKLEDGDDYEKDWYDIIQRTASGVGTFVGVPAGTLMRDFKPLLDKVFENAFAADGSDADETEYAETVVDKAMKRLGYRRKDRGEREESKKQKAFEKERKKIQESVMDLKGEEKAKKTWSKVTTYIKEAEGKSMTDLIAEGDYSTIDKYRTMYEAAGLDSSYFDERVFKASKNALKKSISYEMTDDEMYAQQEQKAYLRMNGMTDEEISKMAYKSDIARDVKVAMMLGDEELVMEAVMPLVQAGLSQEDFDKLWENRNHIDLKKYDGRYKDKLKSTGNYVFPTDGIITSDFGNRSSPGGIGSTNHQGLDIAGPQGTPIQAADGGVVVMAGWYGGYGKTVQIKHDDGTITQYSHLDWWDVNEGDTVAQGQEVGLMGNTGNSTGPHLHFGVMKNGEYVDPKDYINTNDKEWNLNA